jgi:hypothetical protein
MSFQACFFKPRFGTEIKLNVVPSRFHSVHGYEFKDSSSLRDELWSADLAPADCDVILRRLKPGQLWHVPRELESIVLSLVDGKRFDSSRLLPRDIESF